MRLKTAFLTDIEVYRKTSAKSGYIGTENSWEFIGIIKADVQTDESSIRDNPHGETMEEIKNLYIPLSADIKIEKGDRIKHDDKLYEIRSAVQFRTHIKAVAVLI